VNATKPIRQLAEHTAERQAIACGPYTSKRNRSTQKTTKAPPAKDADIPDATGAGLCHRSRTAKEQTNNCVSTVRVSTISGSHEAALVRRTPAARGRITPRRAYTLPVLPSSSVARYLSLLATHSATTSRVRSWSLAAESSRPHSEDIWPGTQSRRNTA